ncbi:MAG: insulinase family protein [Cytophagales bacterium]|nr:insulinase family protein [Cytophagales bacterium]
MKFKHIFSLILTLGILTSTAQLDRSKLPEPSEPRPIQIGDYESFELKNGLKVFIIENHKLPRVAFNLQFDRDPIFEGEKAGYLGMVGDMLRRGTDTRTKEQIDEEVDFIGASLFGGSTSVFASGLSKYQEKILELMTDVVFNPTFSEEELEKIRTETLSGLAANKEDPNSISRNLNQIIVYGADHPYGENQTEETTSTVSADDLRAYHDAYFRPNIAYLAIVGDVDVKKTKKLIKTYFSNWEAKEIIKSTYDMPASPEKNQVNIVNKSSSVQSVISVTYPAKLDIGTPDVLKVRVMNQILGGSFNSKLNLNLREDKGYTYGVGSSISSDELVSRFNAGTSVRNEVTDSSIVQIIYEMTQMLEGKFNEEDLNLAKNSIAGSFSRSLESPQTVARFALNSAIYNLPEDYYSGYIQRLQAITLEDVQAMATKYIKPENAYINIVGKAGDIADKLAQFGEVKYYDTYGNEVDPSLAKLPDGLTADAVFEKHIAAIGGKDKVAAIENVSMKMDASVMGQTMEIDVVRALPNKSFMEMKMGGNVMQTVKFNGQTGFMKGMGGEKIIEGDDAAEMALESVLFFEISYASIGVETKVIAVESIDGNEAYGIEVKSPSGKISTRYYDAESGLLVRVSNTTETPQGTMILSNDYGDYKEFGGVLFPTSQKRPMNAQMKMDIAVNEVIVNSEVSEDLFKQ